MVMVIDIDKMTCQVSELRDYIAAAVPEMQVHVMHEDIFNSMHRI
jgi:ACT domain-containing protein